MKTNSKWLIVILCLIIAIFCFTGLVSCNLLPPTTEHTHEWGEWTITKAATCEEPGSKTHVCNSCSESESTAIPALGHEWSEATCETPRTCTRCSATDGTAAGHTYTLETVKEEAFKSAATCTSPAVYYKSCECGHISTSDKDTFTSGAPLPHVHDQEVVKDEALKSAVTCTSAAVYYKSCQCGHVSENEEETFTAGEPSAHVHSEKTAKEEAFKSAATCTSPAIYYKSCKCGHISTSDAETFTVGEPTPHVHDKEIVTDDALKSATSCTSAAVYYKSCQCGHVSESEEETFTVGVAAGHSYNLTSSTDATCTSPATKTYQCHCGDEYIDKIGDALGHSTSGVIPTERHIEGCEYVLVYTCSRDCCGEEIEGDHVFHHTYVASITASPTCQAAGTKTLTCSCGDTKEDPIPADDAYHSWIAGEITDGKRTDTCKHCESTKTVTVYAGNTTDSTSANDLKNTEIELNDANINLDDGVIDQIGDKNITLSADKIEGEDRNAIVTEDQLAQVGDNPIYNFTINDGTQNISQFGEDNWVTITLPYVLSEGEDVDSIAVWFISDEGELESIKATYNNGYVTFKTNHFSCYAVTLLTPAQRCELYGHSYTVKHVAGDCTHDSYDLYLCVRCHESHKENVVTADGHDYKADTHEATCTESGYVLYSCSDCDHTYRTKIAATGHSWQITDFRDATCAAEGYKSHRCEICGVEYAETYKKLPHSYNDTVISATCESDGYTVHECRECGHTYTDAYVSARGHSFDTPIWNWADDYSSATVNLICSADEEHTLVLTANIGVTVIHGTCSNFVKTVYRAAVTYNGRVYADEKSVETGTPDHSFSSEWKSDENSHWHECICGEKSNVAEHVYANGVCTVCGNAESVSECDHSDLQSTSVDMGKLGFCDWVLHYTFCDSCGGKYIDTANTIIECNFEFGDIDEYIDDDGNAGMRGKGRCTICGLECEAFTKQIHDGCTDTYINIYSFTSNGEPIVENIETSFFYENHNVAQAEIDISKYGACGGTLTVDKCADCGKIVSIRGFAPECNIDVSGGDVKEVVGDDGVVHYIREVKCPDCGFTVSEDMWREEISACECIIHTTRRIECAGTVIFEDKINQTEENHNYEYTYTLNGDTCEDGYTVRIHCDICGKTSEDERYGHELNRREIDLAEYGLCGGMIREGYCEICGAVEDRYIDDYACQWEYRGDDSEGRETCTCDRCGATKYHYIYDSEKDENCIFIRTEATLYVVGGEEVLLIEDSFEVQDHRYTYHFSLNGDSCTDGYTVSATCKDCGDSYNETKSDHASYVVFSLDGVSGCCDGHTFKIWSCPCGRDISYSRGEDFEYDNELNAYVCHECGIKIFDRIDNRENGCEGIEAHTITVMRADEEIYSIASERVYKNHNFRDISISTVGGVRTFTSTCTGCGERKENEIYNRTLENHGDEYYCEYEFTPDASGGYWISGYSNIDTDMQIILFKIKDGEYIEITGTASFGNSFEMKVELDEAETYVYRFRAQKTGDINFIIGNDSFHDDTVCNHEFIAFSVLPDGSNSCEDGVLTGYVCSHCGRITKISLEYIHVKSVTEINLSEYGACYGELICYQCACDKEHYVEFHGCADIHENNTYIDGDGKTVHVETLRCDKCGIYYTHSFYSVVNKAACTETSYNTITVSIGGELVYNSEYTTTIPLHDFEMTYTLIGGEGSSCEDGVIFNYECRNCGYSERHEESWHGDFTKQIIDLSDYGCLCGGYAELRGCACGKINHLSLEGTLCDFGQSYPPIWIENILTDNQYNINEWTSIDSHSIIYICAVTDPEACAYKIRYAHYWLKAKDECKAYEYETWQFGYNEEDGTCAYELTYKTGESSVYHDYTVTETAHGTLYECSDCGSTYETAVYYNDDGAIIKEEITVNHTPDDGNNRYYQRITEHAFGIDGNHYTSRIYYKRIYADGSEYWSEECREETPYVGTFGDRGCLVISRTSNSDGYSYVRKTAYVEYKSYQYNVYEYVQDGDYWYRYDYTYCFDGICTVTVTYSNSHGDQESYTENCCRGLSLVTEKDATCSQDGDAYQECSVCGHREHVTLPPHDHCWIGIENGQYRCSICGLENANGTSGSVIMEDLTNSYGNGVNYVVGYYAQNDVRFTYYVSIVLEDGNEIILDGVDFSEAENLRAVVFSKAQVEELAAARDYTDSSIYHVRFAFVPYGQDGSFDYSITFS